MRHLDRAERVWGHVGPSVVSAGAPDFLNSVRPLVCSPADSNEGNDIAQPLTETREWHLNSNEASKQVSHRPCHSFARSPLATAPPSLLHSPVKGARAGVWLILTCKLSW